MNIFDEIKIQFFLIIKSDKKVFYLKKNLDT